MRGIGPESVRFDLIGERMNVSSSTVERGVTNYRQHKTRPRLRSIEVDGLTTPALVIPGTTCGDLMSLLLETMEILLLAFPGKEYEFLAQQDKSLAEWMPMVEAVAQAAGKKDEFLATRDRLLAGINPVAEAPAEVETRNQSR